MYLGEACWRVAGEAARTRKRLPESIKSDRSLRGGSLPVDFSVGIQTRIRRCGRNAHRILGVLKKQSLLKEGKPRLCLGAGRCACVPDGPEPCFPHFVETCVPPNRMPATPHMHGMRGRHSAVCRAKQPPLVWVALAERGGSGGGRPWRARTLLAIQWRPCVAPARAPRVLPPVCSPPVPPPPPRRGFPQNHHLRPRRIRNPNHPRQRRICHRCHSMPGASTRVGWRAGGRRMHQGGPNDCHAYLRITCLTGEHG